jgi:hypothetical protein
MEVAVVVVVIAMVGVAKVVVAMVAVVMRGPSGSEQEGQMPHCR